LAEIKHQKILKAKAEAEKLRKMNMGATDFMRQQKQEAKLAKLNKNIPKNMFVDQGGPVDTAIIKNKGKAPVEASMVYDAEGLADQLKDLMQDYKTLVDDAKQVSKNVYDGEQALGKAKGVLSSVLTERSLLVNKGQIEKQPDPTPAFDMSGVDTKKLLEQAAIENQKTNPIDPIVARLAEKGYDAEAAFDILDDNMDGVLTIKEIEDGFAHHKIVLTAEEWKHFM